MNKGFLLEGNGIFYRSFGLSIGKSGVGWVVLFLGFYDMLCLFFFLGLFYIYFFL